MKKSERLKRFQHLSFGDEIVAEEEALGVVWDPEEPSLPGMISYNGLGNLVVPGGSRRLTLEEVREVVRRYNAWEALIELNDEIYSRYGPPKCLRVQRILKGEPHG